MDTYKSNSLRFANVRYFCLPFNSCEGYLYTSEFSFSAFGYTLSLLYYYKYQ